MKNGKITNLTRIVARLTCFVVLLFSCPLFVHASISSALPYFPEKGNNVLSSSDVAGIQAVISHFDSTADFNNPYYIIRTAEGAWYDWSNYTDCLTYIVYFPSGDLEGDNSIFFQDSSWGANTNFESFQFFTNNNTISVDCSFTRYILQRREIGDPYNGFTYVKDTVNNGGLSFFGSDDFRSIDNITGTFIASTNYPVYVSGQFTTVDYLSNIHTFLTNGLVVPDEPEPTDPEDPDPITPDIPSPVFPDFPDSPTVENLLTWIGNCIKAIGTWLAGFGSWLKGALNTIITNIVNGFSSVIANFKSLFKPFIDKAIAFYDEITTTIQNGFTDLISLITDIKTALENVKKFFDYIVSIGTENGQFTLTTLFVNLFIPSSADINQAFIDTDSFALITFFKTAFNKVSTIWDSIVNASVKKSIHVNGFIFHGVTIPGFDIDFSWFDNIKSYSDVIISAFLIINYIWFIFFRAPSFIRGHSNLAGAVGGVIDNHDSKGNVT